MGYGLFQGLNEAYDSYRGRERDIEDKARREFEDEQAKTDADRRKTMFDRETEQYKYGLEQRPMQEKSAKLALEEQERQGKMGVQTLKEFMNPKSIKIRDQNADNQSKLIKAQLESQKITFDQKKLDLNVAKSTANYNKWGSRWMNGKMTMEELINEFNSDTDAEGNKIEENDVTSVTGDAVKGWEVTMKNGEVLPFSDRDAVAMHIQRMASPAFNQQYLLQKMADKQALAVEAAKALNFTPKDLLPFKKNWETLTEKSMAAHYADGFKESMINFGDPGNKKLQGNVRAIIEVVGANMQYQGIVHADLAREVVAKADLIMQTDPTELRKMATEEFEEMPVDAIDKKGDPIFPNGKPETGTADYDAFIKNMEYKEVERQFQVLASDIYSKYLHTPNSKGEINPKQQSQEAGNTITTEGLYDEPDKSASGRENLGLSKQKIEPTAEAPVDNRPPKPSVKNPMKITQMIGAIINNIGTPGSAYSDAVPEEQAEPKLSQKAKRKLSRAAEQALDGPYKEFTTEEKIKWLEGYGKKFLSAKAYQKAVNALPKKDRAFASKGNGLKKKL